MDEEYALVEPFPSDDLQFALGVEWAAFRQKLLTGEPFSGFVTTVGLPGLVAMCERHNRFCESYLWPDPQLKGDWSMLIVGGEK